MVISGIGGLGHIAVQYAVAMGLRVIAVDIATEKLDLASRLSAEYTVNAGDEDPGSAVQKYTEGGSHGVLVTAVHEAAFEQALNMARCGGTICFNELLPGEFPASVFDIVFRGLTICGSMIGTQQDMTDALDFFARGLIIPTVTECSLDDFNDIFKRRRNGQI